MEFVAVIVATLAAYGFGAFWYFRMSKPWIKAAGIALDATGKPQGNGNPMPFIMGFLCILVVAGMMRHVFVMSGLNSVLEGLMGGFGIGAFFIAPWTMINNAYPGRPFLLTIIDGAYAIIGCTLMGVVLALF